MLGIKDRILPKDGICQSHQPTVVLALLTLHKYVTCTSDTYHGRGHLPLPAVLLGSRAHRMPTAGLSKGQWWIIFPVVLPKL